MNALDLLNAPAPIYTQLVKEYVHGMDGISDEFKDWLEALDQRRESGR